jgi:endoglucanase
MNTPNTAAPVRLDLKAHLRALTETHAPSGHEAAVRAVIRDAWSPYVDAFAVDAVGNLIATRRGTQPENAPRRTIMLAAHMDEIGMMVNAVVDGFVFVHRISGVDARLLLAQPVLIHTAAGPIAGVVAARPPHLQTPGSAKKYPTFPELVIDPGLPAAEVAARVRIGDLITIDAPFTELLGTRVCGKAFDDRACVAAVTVCLEALRGVLHTWDVVAVATVQEETGMRGAKVSAFQVQPDIAIALDVGFAPQPGVSGDSTIEMGGGPGLGIGPNFHPRLNERIREAAKALEMRVQDDPLPGNSGTDAWAIQVARSGVPTALLEVPVRNMHSPVETADLRDIERIGRLMSHFIARLDDGFMASIAWPDRVSLLDDAADGGDAP